MRYIKAFCWTTAIDVAFCGIPQRLYINRCNIRVLVALDLAIATLHKPATINISFCGILQWWYIKPTQYISFSGISITYSGGLDDCRNRYCFEVLFRSYSGGLDRRNKPFNCPYLDQCIPLLFWPKCHFAFSFLSLFIFQYTLFVVSSTKKPTHTLSLSLLLVKK